MFKMTPFHNNTVKEDNIISTVTGLAVALDTSRKVILDYENYCEHDDKLKSLNESVKHDISNTIKRIY